MIDRVELRAVAMDYLTRGSLAGNIAMTTPRDTLTLLAVIEALEGALQGLLAVHLPEQDNTAQEQARARADAAMRTAGTVPLPDLAPTIEEPVAKALAELHQQLAEVRNVSAVVARELRKEIASRDDAIAVLRNRPALGPLPLTGARATIHRLETELQEERDKRADLELRIIAMAGRIPTPAPIPVPEASHGEARRA